MTVSSELQDLKKRRDKARTARDLWSPVLQDAYAFMSPFRRTNCDSSGRLRLDHLFDNTGVVSTFRGAGQLQQDIFPPGQVFFNLRPGPIAKAFAKATAAGEPGPEDMTLEQFERQLDNVSNQVAPFFLTGEWDNAVSELCLDLYIGTGCMLILEGDDTHPIRFVTLPFEEVALENGPYGDTPALFWRTRMSRTAIKAAFPNGRFDTDFESGLRDNPNTEVDIDQDFYADGKGWVFTATLPSSEVPIAQQRYRTQPFVASRFYRLPGSAYGVGPALLALPTVKTLNKAMELSLKNYAIQMLGIWGYRPGGTFNPETAPLRPGGFWAMQSTGGVVGPDVQRLDAGGNTAAMQNIVLGDLRNQAQTSLHDEQLPDGGATPKSAAEIMGRLARMKQNYVGAYGRMIHEVIPVVIPRVMEIANKRNLIHASVAIDQLLVSIQVVSPIAQALRADRYKVTVEALQLAAGLEGQPGMGRRFKLDSLMPDMIRDLGVDSNYVRTAVELAAYDKSASSQASASAFTQAVLDKPDKFAQAVSPTPDGMEAA